VNTVVAHTENFPTAWELVKFPLLFRNTLAIALVGMTGTLLSSICVAYAFARFPIPGKNILFIVLIGTIILPDQVTLIPTYALFAAIGWTGTWLPLMVPHFFSNAYNVFLLRQFFMTLPRELDEAAMIDGATPFQILTKVIIPQAWPAIIAVGLFHFVFAWNDYFGPLLYLLGQPDLQPISVGVQIFNFRYSQQPQLVQATSLMAMVLPLVIFFFAQKVFMRGVVITGVEK
jgi:multiple sugar transport system permease protein